MQKINRLNLLFFGFALLAVVVGLIFIWVGGQISHLTCNRAESNLVNCELQRQFLGLFPVSRQELHRVSSSNVQEDCSDGCRYWIELLAGDVAVRLTGFSSYNRQAVINDQKQIAQFLDNPAHASFEFAGSPSWVLLIASLPMIVVGAVLAISYGKILFRN